MKLFYKIKISTYDSDTHHILLSMNKPSPRIKTASLHTKSSILLPARNGMQILFSTPGVGGKIADLYNNYLFSFHRWSAFHLIPELDTSASDLNFRMYGFFGQPATASGICRSYRTSAFQWYSSAGSAAAVELHSQRTYDGMPFLRQSGVPCPVSCSNRRNHKRR